MITPCDRMEASHQTGHGPQWIPSGVAADVEIGAACRISESANLYGCRIGEGSRVGAFVEIQRGVSVGSHCKVSSHSFLCEGVTLEDGVFIGHGVMFTNDRHPRALNAAGEPAGPGDWKCEETVVEAGASIGSGTTLRGGIRIGRGAMIGAGSVVLHDVPAGAVAAGNPARILRGDAF